jgi:hypothetical protein
LHCSWIDPICQLWSAGPLLPRGEGGAADRSIFAIVDQSEAQAFGAGPGGPERHEPSDKTELPARPPPGHRWAWDFLPDVKS